MEQELKVFSIYDCKAEAYLRPFVAQSTNAAIRSFSDEINGKGEGSLLATHPEDYTLFELGTWNERKGTMTPYETKLNKGVGIDYLRVDESKLKAV